MKMKVKELSKREGCKGAEIFNKIEEGKELQGWLKTKLKEFKIYPVSSQIIE
jgi:hypothetical protein